LKRVERDTRSTRRYGCVDRTCESVLVCRRVLGGSRADLPIHGRIPLAPWRRDASRDYVLAGGRINALGRTRRAAAIASAL